MTINWVVLPAVALLLWMSLCPALQETP